MPYCTQSDIEAVFGARNVARWSNLDNDDSAADTARINTAIAWASDYLDSRLRRRFAVPLSGGGAVLTDWCAKLAGVWLYEARGQDTRGAQDENANSVRLHKPIVNAELDALLSGARDIGLDLVRSTEATAPFIAH